MNNYGDCKRLKDIYELRIHLGPGYRIYFGKQNDKLIILLAGGSKGTQAKDIEKARKYWQEYLEKG